eukprot:COSAG01_NODE_7997_length_2958_cov_5.321091_2_plen_62_part_00
MKLSRPPRRRAISAAADQPCPCLLLLLPAWLLRAAAAAMLRAACGVRAAGWCAAEAERAGS